MKHLFFASLFLLFAGVSFAQNIPDAGTGTGTGGSGTGSNNGNSGSSGSSGGGTPTSGELGSTINMPEFQGFQTTTQTFIGITDNAPFVGVDDMSGTQAKATSSRRNTSTSGTSASRRTSSSRMSASRSTMGRSGTGSQNSRSVRATTTAEFGFSPLEVGNREMAFRTRLPRLNLDIVPAQINVQVGGTPAGTVATLNGTVATQRDRKLIQQLLLLEPGIDKVDNKLTVSTDSNTTPIPVLE